jgi:membrane protein
MNRKNKSVQKTKQFLSRTIKITAIKMDTVYPPGFQGHSLYTVGKIFIRGILQGFVSDRAASVAFSFFTALFPLLLFFFTLIPYIPINNFQEDLLLYIQNLIPPQIWDIIDDTITYIIVHKSGNLLSISVILSLYLGTNGINSLFNAFNQSYHDFTTTANWLKQRWHSFIILMSVFVLLLISVVALGFGKYILSYLTHESFAFLPALFQILFNIVRISIAVFSVMIAIALLYYFGSSKPHKFTIFTPGNIISTILIIVITLGFNYYIVNFSHYNVLYGSLGTILVLTFYIYINAIFLLIGFEINASIGKAKNKK